MPRIYARVRRPVARAVNPLLLPKAAIPDPVPEPTPAPAPEPVASTDMTLRELQEMAEDAGVPAYGTKADIVARLNADD